MLQEVGGGGVAGGGGDCDGGFGAGSEPGLEADDILEDPYFSSAGEVVVGCDLATGLTAGLAAGLGWPLI